MRRLALLPIVALLALVAGGSPSSQAAPATPAGLTSFFSGSLSAAKGTYKQACHARLATGAPGVATRTVALPNGLGQVRIAIGEAAGDWDVAVFDAAGSAVAASAELGTTESATGYTASGGAMTVQACRRTGAAKSVPATLSHAPVTGDADAVRKDPPQLVSIITPTRAKKQLAADLGLDLSEHAGEKSVGAVLYGAADRERLAKAGLDYEVRVKDLVRHDLLQRRAETRAVQRSTRATALPSGRTGTYRVLADYNAELKQLAEENPTLVKLFTMPHKTFLGKEILGVEIAENVTRQDGRPAFFNMGVHHAREWPAGEMPMEWAHELVSGYKKGDARARSVMQKSRNIVVPIVNADGFEASRSAGSIGAADGGRNPAVDDLVYIVGGAAVGGEYRRKNCRLPDDSDAANCLTSPGAVAENGVDPNRNYGGLWGGPGSGSPVYDLTYRGKAPFSEPETQNIQHVVSTNQVMSLITNHTTAALVLRAPGVAALGDPVDEDKGYKALGDAMAKENGYFSQKGFELYDTTGTTEDWSYNATGGFGFTFEIYCGAPNYNTGDCDAPSFHPTYEIGVEKEWSGDNDTANHVNDPAGPYDGKGNREAYYIAAESAIDTERHSVIEGTAPAGAELRLTKTFMTQTSPQADGKPIEFEDKLETVYDVGSDGRFEWHINPSTRPIVAKGFGRDAEGPPSPTVTGLDGAAGVDARPCPTYHELPADSGLPGSATDDTCYIDHPFEFKVGGGVDNESASIKFTFGEQDDWDLELYEDVDGDGKSDVTKDKALSNSGEGVTSGILGIEETSLGRPKQTTKYVARMINYAAVGGYTGQVEFTGPPPKQEPKLEKWTLTCEVGGKVLQTTTFEIARGERKSPGVGACIGKATAKPGPNNPAACKVSNGFKRVGVTPSGRGAKLTFARTKGVKQKVAIKVYKHSIGRKVIPAQVVARFARKKSVNWNGRANRKRKKVTDGFYFVRFRVKGDTRRVVLRRQGGRFKVVQPFHKRATCGLLRQFKLGRSVFGGSGNTPLKISYLLGEAADVTVVVRQGNKVIKEFATESPTAGTFKRLRLPATGLKRGDYTVTLTAKSATSTVTAKLTSRRL